MKLTLSALSLFLFLHSHSQADNSVPVTGFNTYGYISGHRLDSLQSSYADFATNLTNRINFDYGQTRTGQKPFIIADSSGHPLSFPDHSLPFLLNFFHYNHWELVCPYEARWVLRKESVSSGN